MNQPGQAITLIILRHGKAEKAAPGQRDDDRRLTARGSRQARFVAEQLGSRGLIGRTVTVVSSPLTRAVGTAMVAAQVLGVCVELDERLSTRGDERDHLTVGVERAEAIAGTQDGAAVLLVGHNPTLSGLVGLVLARDQRWAGELRTGEAAVVRFGAGVRRHTGTLLEVLRLSEDDGD